MKKLLSILSLSSCIIAGTVGGHVMANDVDAKQIVAGINSSWNQSFNQGDSSAIAKLYSQNASLSPGNGEILVGQQKIEDLFKSFIDNGVHNHAIETIEAYMSNDQIIQIGHWSADGINDQQQKISFGGVLMTVIEKNTDGQWLTRSHVWNMAN